MDGKKDYYHWLLWGEEKVKDKNCKRVLFCNTYRVTKIKRS